MARDRDVVGRIAHDLTSLLVRQQEKVPCLVVTDLDDPAVRAFSLANNRLAEQSEWDEEVLKLELAALESLDLDFSPSNFAASNRACPARIWPVRASSCNVPRALPSLIEGSLSLLRVFGSVVPKRPANP